jgi:hypothetical protein
MSPLMPEKQSKYAICVMDLLIQSIARNMLVWVVARAAGMSTFNLCASRLWVSAVARGVPPCGGSIISRLSFINDPGAKRLIDTIPGRLYTRTQIQEHLL